ncbi:MAG: hypothetical protein AW09_004400 [Candidatus Accumulibacter phosphatis]|uniref:Uncharacterized protein n=1 Tax=Candidatus Accumulibacter phosphatis TaxID=327160 RepID=A0A084Y713_9PROT|nr:MAG: hypothetical protein AW09_004400 [Candidatus Accumulibacter phosphatis]MBL8406201.1 hypothetical protein [Accumulibacter sp.]
MKPRRTAIVWLPGDEGMIDAALLPGTIAAAVYPHPPRDADWPASDGFMLKRLKCERSITAALRRKLGSAIDSEDFKLTQGEARTFLSELGCALEVRTFGEAAPLTTTPATTGLVAWQAEVLENWQRIVSDHGAKPTARSIMAWLKKNGRRDVISASQPNRDSLRWIDGDANPHTVTLGSIGNRCAEWRRLGKLPA